MDKIIEEMREWAKENIEKPSPIFADLPPCPFARKARLEGKIHYNVTRLSKENVLEGVNSFIEQPYEAIVFIHPDKKDISPAEVRLISEEVNKALEHLNMQGFGGHPEEDFNIAGFYTRRDPYPNVQVIRHQLVERARISLVNTSYYDKWTPENLKSIEYEPPPKSIRSRPSRPRASGM